MPALASPAFSEFGADLLAGLARPGQKQIPSRWLYDALGSALFEAITLLPEYGLTRADARLLQAHAGTLAAALPDTPAIAELGSGVGTKTRWILDAFRDRRPLRYFPIDVSGAALEVCAAALGAIPGVAIQAVPATYLEGLLRVREQLGSGERMLVLFLGSTIGNFDAIEARAFLSAVRSELEPGDALLLGADLIKPLPQLLAAYDDPTGVTAAFNLNVLGRINRELGANFDLRQFEHHACFNQEESRIEMHLRARRRQVVEILGIEREISIEAGETIWTESSYKFRRSEILNLARDAGFGVRAQWVDEEWPFAESLLTVQ